ncbi:MAG: LEA14-like dessication related protein [Maribacter sp.]|jgi:LEA14-like dessication related protein
MKYSYLLLFLFPLIMMSCGSSKEITFKEMTNVRLKSVEVNGTIKVTADAVLNNPRRVKAKVTYLECQVYVEGKPLAEVTQIKETKVPKRSDFSVPLETSISLKKVLGSALSLATKIMKDGKVNVKLNGTVKVKVLGKTFTIPFDVTEETELSL